MSIISKTANVLKSVSNFNFANAAKYSSLNAINPTFETKYGGKHRVTLIHGDGTGPEMMSHIKETFRHLNAPVEFEDIELNKQTACDSLIDQAVYAIKRNGVGINGTVETDYTNLDLTNPNTFSVNVQLIQKLNLFANIVRCKSLDNVETRHKDIDILIIRQNTEGEYAKLEHESVPGVVESLKIITREKSLQIAEFAFHRAELAGRKKVTAVHKANIMKLGDGLFIKCCKEVAAKYPHIEYEEMIVDNTCMQMVSKPQQFDVMVMPNLYGNIVSNLAVGLTGSSELVGGSNYGTDCAIYEPGCRSSGRGNANTNTANPSGFLIASANMLKYIGLKQQCSVIKQAVVNTITERNVKTADIGGMATTSEFMNTFLDEVKYLSPEQGFENSG